MFAPPWWRHGGQPCKKVVGRARAHHLVSLIPGRRQKKKMGHFPGPIRSDMPVVGVMLCKVHTTSSYTATPQTAPPNRLTSMVWQGFMKT